MARYYIGIDIGTTSTKGALFDEYGCVIKKISKEYGIISLQNGFMEQNPDEIFDAVVYVLKELILNKENDIEFVSFSSMMHSIMAVDNHGYPLTNCIIWADNRSSSYVKSYKINGLGLKYYTKTGTPIHAMSPLYKLMWLRDNEKDVFDRAYKFISIKEYVLYKLFNEYVVDYSIASATGLFNIFDLKWDEEILSDIGIKIDKFSDTVETTFSLKKLKDEYKKFFNLNKDVHFVVGASDGCLANLGSGAIDNKTAAITIGTSGAVRVAFDRPYLDNDARIFCYYLYKNKYIIGGAINNGGIAYKWFKDTFAGEEQHRAKDLNIDVYELLNEYVKNTPIGSNGVMFLPFLSGERSPYWNSNLKGTFLGIKTINNKKDFTRAIIEGICYSIRDVYEIIEEFGEINNVKANGGFVKSNIWIQILSDIIGTKIEITEDFDTPVIGAYILGLLSNKEISSIEDGIKFVKTTNKYNPNIQNKKIYDYLFSIYKEAINGLMPILEKL